MTLRHSLPEKGEGEGKFSWAQDHQAQVGLTLTEEFAIGYAPDQKARESNFRLVVSVVEPLPILD